MSQTILAHSPASSTKTVDSYQYSLALIDSSNSDLIEIFQYFNHKPQASDWLKILSDWHTIGFKLHSQPRLVRFITI